MMEIRKTETADLDSVLRIYDKAREFMRGSGNMVQWTNGYPGRDIVQEDIGNGCSYVCISDGEITAVFSLVLGEDPTYQKIYGGEWLNNLPYATIHRIAAGVRKKGVAGYCIDWCFARCHNLRIDTHEANRPMRNLIEKCGFQYCGIIYLPDGSPRLAFQKSDTPSH